MQMFQGSFKMEIERVRRSRLLRVEISIALVRPHFHSGKAKHLRTRVSALSYATVGVSKPLDVRCIQCWETSVQCV